MGAASSPSALAREAGGRGDGKADSALRTISEVARELGVEAHVLRFWETQFPQIRPLKHRANRRYYRPADVAELKRIKALLYEDGFTIRGAKQSLKQTKSEAEEAAAPAPHRTEPLELLQGMDSEKKALQQGLTRLHKDLCALRRKMQGFQ